MNEIILGLFTKERGKSEFFFTFSVVFAMEKCDRQLRLEINQTRATYCGLRIRRVARQNFF